MRPDQAPIERRSPLQLLPIKCNSRSIVPSFKFNKVMIFLLYFFAQFLFSFNHD